MRLRSLMMVFAAFVAARALSAQSNGVLIPIPNRSYIGINPMGIPFDIFTAEGETGVAQGVTIGGVASHLDVNDQRYTSFDFKVRYYPGEVVLQGLSFGASLGTLDYTTKPSNLPQPNGVPSSERQSLTTPTVGVIADYNWLLGAEHRFVVGTGIGAKRIVASGDDRARVGLDRAYVTARFTVGLAF